MAMDFITALAQKIEQQRLQTVVAMAKGSAKDFAEYQYLCGRIRGLADAIDELTDLAQTLKEPDED